MRGYLAESADAVTLPRAWPSLRDVEFFVDTQVFGLNRTVAMALRLPGSGRMLEYLALLGLPLARLAGSRFGGYIIEVLAGDSRVAKTSAGGAAWQLPNRRSPGNAHSQVVGRWRFTASRCRASRPPLRP